MKKVIRRQKETNTVCITQVTGDRVYLGHSRKDVFCIVTALRYRGNYRCIKFDQTFTLGNGYGADEGYGTLTELFESMDEWEFYQFGSMQEAMQYFIEQTTNH